MASRNKNYVKRDYGHYKHNCRTFQYTIKITDVYSYSPINIIINKARPSSHSRKGGQYGLTGNARGTKPGSPAGALMSEVDAEVERQAAVVRRVEHVVTDV